MYPRGSLSDPGALDALVARLGALRADSPRQWGRMTPHQAVCHLNDAFLVVKGDRKVTGSSETILSRTLIKVIALRSPMPWPKGSPTMKEVDAEKEGTRPVDFDSDRAMAMMLLREFAGPNATYARHPFFGDMSRSDWMLWGFGHTDHHLRQFGA